MTDDSYSSGTETHSSWTRTRSFFTGHHLLRPSSYASFVALPGAAAERWPCASFATSGAGLFATHVRCRWALHCDLDARRLLVGVVLLGPQDFPCRMWSDKGGASYTHIPPPACTGMCTFHALWLYPLAAHLCCAVLRLGVLTVLKVLNTHQRFIVCADQPAFRWRGRGGSA